MDLPRYDQPSGTDVDPVDNTTDALKMHKKVAWPVGDEMLQLISKRNVPSGFDAEAFVKNSLVETFGSSMNQTTACPSSERDTFCYSSKRKRCSVVDSALGTMGYDALKVCDTKANYLMEMLTSWIQWRSTCNPVCDYLGTVEEPNASLRSRKFHSQLCAQRIPVGMVLQVVQNCKAFFATVEDDGTRVREIVDALLKLATDTCMFAPRAESVNGVCNKTIYAHDAHRRKDNLWALQSIIDFVLEHRRSIYSKLRPGSRLRFWRIRPSCLKQDISSLANEAMLRYLLPLDTELSQREELVILVVCLSMAPEMFAEARRLLHHWLLSSGALRLWELRAGLVEAVWDVANHPSVWGLRHDVHLPPKFAFYCVALRPFVQILEGPPTVLGLFRLLKLLDDMEKLPHQQDADTFEQSTSLLSTNHFDHNSIWSLLIDFYPWLVLATKLLFRNRNLKHASTGTSERYMYESMVSSEKCGVVLSESEFDFAHVNSRVAAKYLAWTISPINRLHRESYEQMFLSLNTSWRKSQEDFGLESCSRLSGPHDYGALKAAVQTSCIKCTRCGSPVKMVTSAANKVVDAVCGKENKSLPALNLWLALLQKNLRADITRVNAEEKKYAAEEVDSRKGRSLIINSYCNSSLFLIHYLPLAALSESLTICNIETVVSLLQFVSSCEVEIAHSSERAHEAVNQSRAQYFPVCKSCDALRNTEHLFSQSSGSQARPSAVSSKPHKTASATGGGPEQNTRTGSADWILGIAAVFNILNSLDDDVLLLAGSGLPVVDPTVERRRVTDHTAVIVAEYVIEWSRSLETVFSQTAPPPEGSVTYKTILEDLLCRFCRWIGKLSLSSEAARICSETREVVATRIKNVKSAHSQ